jgi:hypothetical protein
MSSGSISIDISSSTIRVGNSYYKTDKIDSFFFIEEKDSLLSLAVMGRKYSIIIIFERYQIKLISSRDEEKMHEICYKIDKAIAESRKGDKNSISSVTLNGDIVNQSGDFGVGFNSGVIN